jgi:hypothetical protein
MRTAKLGTVLVGLLAFGTVGCSLDIQKTFAMKDGGNVLDVAISCADKTCDVPIGQMSLEGAAVMNIAVSTTLLDYLDGTVDGDIEVVDVLFAVPGILFFGLVDSGLICVVPEVPAGGGTFTYDTLGQKAVFDAAIHTKALLTNPAFANIIKGGALAFPFQLHSTVPLSLVDALGLFTGASAVEVTQPIDEYYTVTYNTGGSFFIHATGAVTLQTTDTFPATPNVVQCLDYLNPPGA